MENMNGFYLAGRNLKVNRPSSTMSSLNTPMTLSSNIPNTNSGIPSAQSLANPLVAASAAASIAAARVAPYLCTGQAVSAIAGPLPLPSPSVAAMQNAPTNRIYVGSIHWDIGEMEIRSVFCSFGVIKSCILMPNPETGKHKGYCFIEYDNEKSASEAMLHMNNFPLGGRQLKVGRAVGTGVPNLLSNPLAPFQINPLMSMLSPQLGISPSSVMPGGNHEVSAAVAAAVAAIQHKSNPAGNGGILVPNVIKTV
eukprot:TRINITY_DN3656_c0_g1_i1.p1 TRINITY_DN3656_c0_g1~~TRINITY_DN3656_c0_g1_i1.p1  ORF type:complete len:253 (-),score=60.36 TRINITY_DN3656_c0_g1_i1:46-804(-)